MPTSSTCSVMGNRSKARSDPRVQPAPRATARSRANGCRLARHIGDPTGWRVEPDQGRHHVATRTCSGRVEHDQVGSAQAPAHDRGGDVGPHDLHLPEAGGIAPQIGNGRSAPFDGHHRPGRADHPGQGHGEQSGTGIQVGDPVTRLRLQAAEYRAVRTEAADGCTCQNTPAPTPKRTASTSNCTWSGARRVRPFQTDADVEAGSPSSRSLPVSTSTTGFPPPGEAMTSSWRAPRQRCAPSATSFTRSVAIGQCSIGSMSWLRWRLSPIRPGGRRRRSPGCAIRARPGHRATSSTATPGRGRPGGELLGHQVLLQPALGRQGDVLEVAAPAPSGTGVGAPGIHPVGRGLQHLDGVGPEEGGRLRGDVGAGPVRRGGCGARRPPGRPEPGPRSLPRRRWPRCTSSSTEVGAGPVGKASTGMVRRSAHPPVIAPGRTPIPPRRCHSSRDGGYGETTASGSTTVSEPPSARGPGSTGGIVDIDEALYTTRAMRRVKPDPDPDGRPGERSSTPPSAPRPGGNTQNWRFLLVDDKEMIARIAPLYRTPPAAVGDRLRRAGGAGRGRTRRVERQVRRCRGRPSGWPTISTRFRCSCSPSSRPTRPAARSFRRCGVPSWPPGPRGRQLADRHDGLLPP